MELQHGEILGSAEKIGLQSVQQLRFGVRSIIF
jgi:hypothetical protein